MINQHIKDSKAYKTYLAFATRQATPKKARKFKKISSPSKKLSLVLEEEPAKKPKGDKKPAKMSTILPTASVVIKDTLNVSVSKKKAPDKVDRGKGMNLLSDVALLEATQLKKALKKSNDDVTNDGNDDISNDDDSDNDDGDNDSDDVMTKFDDDKNDDDQERNEEEYEELYKDVNIRLKDVEQGEEVTAIVTSTIPSITHLSQLSTPTTEVTKTSIPYHPDFSSVFQFNKRVSNLEKELSEIKQADQSAQLLKTIKSQIPAIVDAHLGTRLGDSIQKDFKSYTLEFKKKAQAERKRYIYLVEKSVKDIINDEVKTHLPYILINTVSDIMTPVIKSTIIESLEDAVLEKSSSQP
nr:hypothetical protein [Tanacetum cinerariifolium]